MSKKNEYYKDALNKTGDREVSENMALQNNLVDLKGEKAPEISFDKSPYLPGETPKATNVESSPAGETLNPYEQMMAQGGTSKFFNMNNLDNYITRAGKKYEKSVNTRTAGLVNDAQYGKNAVIDSHNEAYNALRAQNRANINALPGQMTKLGLYGSGTGEVALSNIATDYQNQYNELLKQKNKGLMDIDNQIRQLKQNAANDISNYHAQLAAQYPQYYLQMLQNKIAAFDSDRKHLQSMYQYEDSARRSDYQFDAQRQDEHNRFYDSFNYGKEMNEKTFDYQVAKDEEMTKDAYYQQLLPYFLKNNPNGSGEDFRRWADGFFLNDEGGSLTPPGAYAPTSPAGAAMGNAPVITLNDGTVIGGNTPKTPQPTNVDSSPTPSVSADGESTSLEDGGNAKALETAIKNVNYVAKGEAISENGGKISGYLGELAAKEVINGISNGTYTEEQAAYILENLGVSSQSVKNAQNDIRRNNHSNKNPVGNRR